MPHRVLALLLCAQHYVSMIYPEIELSTWLKKYPITPQAIQCENCKETFKTSVPILIRGYAGLEIPLHDCGREFLAATFIPTHPKEIQYWSALYS